MILSPSNCSDKIPSYERNGDIEKEGAEEPGSVKSSGGGQDDWQGNKSGIRPFSESCDKTFSVV